MTALSSHVLAAPSRLCVCSTADCCGRTRAQPLQHRSPCSTTTPAALQPPHCNPCTAAPGPTSRPQRSPRCGSPGLQPPGTAADGAGHTGAACSVCFRSVRAPSYRTPTTTQGAALLRFPETHTCGTKCQEYNCDVPLAPDLQQPVPEKHSRDIVSEPFSQFFPV